MGAPYGPLKKAVAQPKPDRTGPIPRTLKIEVTGGYGSGKEGIARKICAMLKKELIYSDRVTVRLEIERGVDGNPEQEGPEDATFLLQVWDGEPQ